MRIRSRLLPLFMKISMDAHKILVSSIIYANRYVQEDGCYAMSLLQLTRLRCKVDPNMTP